MAANVKLLSLAASWRSCFISSFIKLHSLSVNLGYLSPSQSSTFTPKILGSLSNGFFSRDFRTATEVRGIEEFFPKGVLESNEPLPEEVPSGRSWRAGELRQKSNEDLHKLWYILLKERNMLLTVQWEARRQNVLMPSPERLHKVKKSMAMIKVVIGERTRAIQDIERRATKGSLELGEEVEQKISQTAHEDKDIERTKVQLAH